MIVTPASVATLPLQEFSDHARQLLARALSSPDDLPIVNRLLAEANGKGMTWTEGLEYVIYRRSVKAL